LGGDFGTGWRGVDGDEQKVVSVRAIQYTGGAVCGYRRYVAADGVTAAVAWLQPPSLTLFTLCN